MIEIDYKVGIATVVAIIMSVGVMYYRMDSIEKRMSGTEMEIRVFRDSQSQQQICMAELKVKLCSIESLMIEVKTDLKSHMQKP